MFTTQFKRNKRDWEPGGGESKTEQGGYLPPNVQIERLIDAGRRLMDSRSENYDLDENMDSESAELLAVRSPNFDLADASMLAAQAKKRLRESRDRALRDKEAAREAEADKLIALEKKVEKPE